MQKLRLYQCDTGVWKGMVIKMKSSGIGGQAVLEGVMMRNKSKYAVAVRKPDGEIDVKVDTCTSEGDRKLFFRLPLIRGVVAFVDSLVLGMKTLTYSASFYEEEEATGKAVAQEAVNKDEADSAAEQDGEKQTKAGSTAEKSAALAKKAEKREQIEMAMTVLLSVVLALAVFVALPFGLSLLLKDHIQSQAVLALIEGLIRLGLFIGYVYVISFMQDINRVFMYHGAEHKTINCVENGDDLTVLNVRKHSRYHKRCGTSFLFIVMLISIVLFMFLHFDSVWLRLLSRLLLVPVVAGISYEFIRLAGNSDSKIVNILSKPGMFLQGLTTREPDDSMIEVAIASVEAVFDWKEYQSRLQAVKKSTKRKKVAEEMRKSGMTAPLPTVDPSAAKKKSGTELASEIKKREQEYKKRADERKKYMEEMQKREDEIAKVMDEVSKRKEERQALAQAQEEMAEDELSSLDRFFDDPDGTKSDMESKPSVDEEQNG